MKRRRLNLNFLDAQKSVCGVDIAWADGASHQYHFNISVSTDGTYGEKQGKSKAKVYGKRNSGEGEVLVRVTPTRILAEKDIAT